ncbi:MAG: enoyl-CoA hydratase/isomerase family protein [Candidatus Paracaedibacteraceae bacterium]|nr:enoyl-CoA hydratase/isomerase family protein [Candidatus Paracaedibacteraceae bacterium]
MQFPSIPSCKHVAVSQKGTLGIITLSRPEALNATSYEMVLAINDALTQFAVNSSVKHIAVRSSSDRSFCAGGDIRSAYYAMQNKDYAACELYFKAEYQLIHRLATFEKPIYAFINGYCFGGGMGLSVHCTSRIVGENAVFSMPETRIGFFPDIGAAYFYNQLKDSNEAMLLACTGYRFKRDHAMLNGIATHAVDSYQWDTLLNQLADGEKLDTCSYVSAEVKDAAINTDMLLAFSKPNLPEIIKALPHSFKDILNQQSPFSIAVTYAYMKRAQGMSLKSVLELDFVLAMNFVKHGEFMEGVRALVIDKDKKPKWSFPWTENVFEVMPYHIIDTMFVFDETQLYS